MTSSIRATAGVFSTSRSATAPRKRDAPIPAKGAHLPAAIAHTMAAIGARNGTTHKTGHAGSVSVPSHQVGLPMLRPVTAAEASAAVTSSHETMTTAPHGLSRLEDRRRGGCGTSVDTP